LRRGGRAFVERDLAEIFERHQGFREIEWPVYIELLNRCAVIEQLQELNLGGSEVDQSGLNLRLILDPQQLDAVEIDLGDVAGIESVSADLDDVVVVLQVLIRHLDYGFGLKGLDEGGAQSKEQGPVKIGMLRLGDLSALLSVL